MAIKVVSLECMRGLYEEDANAIQTWKECKALWSMDRKPYFNFHIQEGFLFKNQ